MKLRVIVNSMNVTVYPLNEGHLNLIREFSGKYIRWNSYWNKWRKMMIREPICGHVFFKNDRSEVRFMRGMLNDFISFSESKGYKVGTNIEVIEEELDWKINKGFGIKFKKDFILRDYQEKALNFCLDGQEGTKILTLSPGKGKSNILLKVAEKLKQRMVIIMRPTYTGEDEDSGWIKNFHKSLVIDENDYCIISGSDNLKKLINLALAGELKYKVIILSNRTLQNYIKNYEAFDNDEFISMGYNCYPQDLPKVLGVNVLFADEVHQDYHFNCKMFSYFKVKNFFCASATINSDDAFIRKILNIAFPDKNRFKDDNYNVYIRPTAIHYSLYNKYLIKHESQMGYSQIKFEQSILKYHNRIGYTIRNNYFDLIYNVLDKYFIYKLKEHPEATCVIICGTIEMCDLLSKYLQDRLPNNKVTRYVEEDPDENLFKSQICVSTILSAGTGQDIPNLRTLILTNGLNSTQANIQVSGRLRTLPNNETPDFVYFVCDDIAYHLRYHEKKKNNIFPGRLLPIRNDYTGFKI